MKELLVNIYGDSIRSIIEDLLKQYKEYEEFTDSDSMEHKAKFIRLLREPIEVYNEHYHGSYVLPKLN